MSVFPLRAKDVYQTSYKDYILTYLIHVLEPEHVNTHFLHKQCLVFTTEVV